MISFVRSESDSVEYKFKLNDSLEKEVISFLNSETGGTIYIGVDDNGEVVGVQNPDANQLEIKDRLKNNISPSCMDFSRVSLEDGGFGRFVIAVSVSSGSEKPYYLRKSGMCPLSCFIRVGSSCEQMSESQIMRLYLSRMKNSLSEIPSPVMNPGFRELSLYYEGQGKSLGSQFLSNLHLLTSDGRVNYAGFLLSDACDTAFRFARYDGVTREYLTETADLGGGSLIRVYERLCDKLLVINKTFVKITGGKRLERFLIDSVALREAVLNALLHNDYSYSASPKFEVFDDRFEITSAGGLAFGLSVDEFFSGVSVCRNPELMRVFHDLGFVEQMGSGVSRIAASYGREAFVLSENFVRVVFPFADAFSADVPNADVSNVCSLSYDDSGNTAADVSDADVSDANVSDADGSDADKVCVIHVGLNERLVLEAIYRNPSITYQGMSLETGLTIKQVEHAVVRLKGMDILVREGAAKTGTWKIFKYNGGNKSEVKGDEFPFVSENKVHYESSSGLKNVRRH